MNYRTLAYPTFVLLSAIAASSITTLLLNSPSTAEAAPALLSVELGPADAVLLAGSPEVRVTAAGGRITWGTQPAARAIGIATVDIGAVLVALTASERYSRDMKTLEEEAEARGEDFRKRWEDMQARMGKIEEGSPTAGAIDEEFQKLRSEVERFQRQIDRRHGDLMLRQYEQAWGEIRSALDVVADRAGADMVIKGTPTAEPFRKGDPESLIQQVRSRTLVRTPEDIDLTDELLKELNITRITPEEESAEEGDAEADSPDMDNQ